MLGGLTAPTDCFMGAKGQGGLDAALAAEFEHTTLNPVLLDSVGTYLLMCLLLRTTLMAMYQLSYRTNLRTARISSRADSQTPGGLH